MTVIMIFGKRGLNGGLWGGLALYALCHTLAQAQSLGVTSQGNTGGLVIPSAQVLPVGTVAASYGNYQEPFFGPHEKQQNMTLGIGLLPYVEFYGRFANYCDNCDGFFTWNGIRDISANLKLQMPTPWARGPKVAVGMNELGGGAQNFGSKYVVTSEQFGPLDVSLGYAKGRAGSAGFDGAFGGVAWRFGNTGVSALAEYDGQQKHAGLRWNSEPILAFGNAQVVGSVQQSFGTIASSAQSANTRNYALTLLIPLTDQDTRAAALKPEATQALPDHDAKPDLAGMQATPEDRMASLRKALIAVGLERVRVGLRESSLGTLLMVEYENHRYAQNEVDALGLVFGLAAELAPKGVQRIQAVTLKEGQRLYETSVSVEAYRAFLRDGRASSVRDSLVWERLPTSYAEQTRWIDPEASAYSPVRVEIKPGLAYTVGTEVGALDYFLAANFQTKVPLWSGARAVVDYVLPLSNSSNMDEGAIYSIFRQPRGVRTLALQQSFWLGRHALTNVGIGRFNYDRLGVQAEMAAFVPGSDNLVRLFAARYDKSAEDMAGLDRAYAASYRHLLSPTMWVDLGLQRYSDGTQGPALNWTRWFGDIGVKVFYNKGGNLKFAGLELEFPLTPRQGMKPGPVIFTGPSYFPVGLRSLITDSESTGNWILPTRVLSIGLATSVSLDQLNIGRLSQGYFADQVYRMRDAFYAYAKNLL